MTTPLTPIPARIPDLRGDVDPIAPTDGDALVWAASTSKWTPTAIVIPTVPVTSVFGRTGAVVAATNDYSVAQINGLTTALATKAPLDSPTFTGVPSGLTATAGTSTTQFATTAFTTTAVAALSATVTTALSLKADDSNVVHKTGAETIAGVKTFSSDLSVNGMLIVGPSGTFSFQDTGSGNFRIIGNNTFALDSDKVVLRDHTGTKNALLCDTTTSVNTSFFPLVLPAVADALIPNGGIAWSSTTPDALKVRTPSGVLKTVTLV